MDDISKQIAKTHDNELEIEWQSNFVINAIINQKVSPLIRIYAFEKYKKFNFDIKKIKNENGCPLYCCNICGTMWFLIILYTLFSYLISQLIYVIISPDDIGAYVVAIIGVIMIIPMFCCTMLAIYYNHCHKSLVKYKYLYKEQKNKYLIERNAYFAV
jgi:hypothetical protein